MANRSIAHWLAPTLLFGLLWWVITRGSMASLAVGIPSIILASFAFERLRNRQKSGIRLLALPEFSAWFLWNSMRGGADVAWRTLQPTVLLQPGFIHYKMELAPGPARIFLLNCLSLLPGTLSADLAGNELILHALDTNQDVIAETREAEHRVQKLFGIDGTSNHD